jgi:hypothetical protein
MNPENALDNAIKLTNKVSYKAIRLQDMNCIHGRKTLSQKGFLQDASRRVEDISTLYFTGSMSERSRLAPYRGSLFK